MKSNLLLICCVCAFFACKLTHKTLKGEVNTNTITLHEGNWISNFKNEVFIRCLKKLYPTELGAMIDSLDASSSANLDQVDFNQRIVEIVDSLATSFTNRHETTWTIEERKVTLNICLSYRNSMELDSIALRVYQKFVEKKADD